MGIICDRLDGCSTSLLWKRVRDAVVSTLDSITLADLVNESQLLHTGDGFGMKQFATFTPRLERVDRAERRENTPA